MATPTPSIAPFLILTPRLILLPTPLARSHRTYTTLYANLHASPTFCTTAFGNRPDSFKPVDWVTDDRVLDVIGREVRRSWLVRGMGDFAVGVIEGEGSGNPVAKGSWRVVDGEEYKRLVGDGEGGESSFFERVRWVGYAGVRDATTTSIPNYGGSGDEAGAGAEEVRPWQEMVELRYGFDSLVWGKGFGSEAARAVMGWCEEVKGVRRVIAECEAENGGSSGVLRKLGFQEREDLQFWGMLGTIEWERWVGDGTPVKV